MIHAARARLDAVIAAINEAGQLLDCQTDRGRRHLSDDPGVRADAAHACPPCPALDACGRYADSLDRRRTFGVWGGQDRTPGRRSATTTQPTREGNPS